jgi:hypothetical protein
MELSYFSNNKTLSNEEYFLVRLAALIPYTEGESRSVTIARARIDCAQRTLEHFKEEKLPPPRFSSFEFLGLMLRGVK